MNIPKSYDVGMGQNWVPPKNGSGWWCNNHLEKYEFVNGKDDIPYIYIVENNTHVPNHQPDILLFQLSTIIIIID